MEPRSPIPAMSYILPAIVENKRLELASLPAESPAEPPPGDGSFLSALSGDGLKFVAEIKPSSPSAGVIRSEINLPGILENYNKYASAISVLTDAKYFGGSLELLTEVSRNSPRPTLCKDFIIAPRQVRDARRAGAQAVLLIVKILTDEELASLHEAILSFGMTPLVEIQNDLELDRALKVSPQALLINNRNLETFDISFETTKRLVPRIPDGILTISASGIETRADIDELLPCCTKFLIGTSLMKSGDIGGQFRRLLASE
jgi:indole-3-glycerol phosphate synthase / phosphoribosylanthranilate isomerase